jgi:hypothetical protein
VWEVILGHAANGYPATLIVGKLRTEARLHEFRG